jgi:hypothetical protein
MFLEKQLARGKSFIWKKPFLVGSVLMDTEKMLEIIETRAWFPKNKDTEEKMKIR